jgi:hypothetical protein
MGRLLALDLRLLRSFIDDRKNTAFARDFANSFLRSATSTRDEISIDTLANQIQFDIPDMKVVWLRRSEVRLPAHRTDEYLAFLGQKEQVVRLLSLTKLTMTNVGGNEERALLMSLETVR